MPEKSQVIPVNETKVAEILTWAYGTLKKLDWTARYSGDDTLIATTADKWDTNGQEITLKANPNALYITSKMVHGEILDIPGKNKKNIQTFINAFESVKTSTNEVQLSEWQDRINLLKEETTLLAEEEIREAKDINKVMNLSGGNMYVTYAIIAINILVFMVMIIKGVSFISPTGEDIVNWGGNFGPYTTTGDWWRLVSSVFVHIGIIHLLFNMYALYTIGVYLEPMLGKTRYIVAYLCTGVFASLLSLWWHDTPVASAGASGAIFGMFGVFLALLSTSLIPKQVRKQLLQSIGIFVGYNLLYGMQSGVDNAAHIGGLISGLVIGYIYYLQLRKNDENTPKISLPVTIAAATIFIAFFYLKNAEQAIKTDDSEKFSKTLEHFGALEELALEAMQPSDTTSKDVYLTNLKKTALNDWVNCVTLFEEAEKFNLPPQLQTFRRDMLQYSNHRLQQTLLFIKAAEEGTEKYNNGLDSIQKEITIMIEKIQEGNKGANERKNAKEL